MQTPEIAFPLPCDYEDTEVSEIRDSDTDPGYEDDDPWADSGAYEGWDDPDDDDDDDDEFFAVPMRTPTPMDEDVPTSRRGHDYEGERDELYRDRLLAEGHVVCLERGGDWSLVMASNVEVL